MNKKQLVVVWVLSTLLSGCGSVPWPGDKKALIDSCQSAYVACGYSCGNNDECNRACTGGYNGCIANIEEDRASDWQPADSFYDGCTDVCSEYPCDRGCVAGQNQAASETAAILRKYGTITQL